MTTQPAQSALHAYRHLLRATRIAFANDSALLHASRSQARATFHKNGSLLSQQSAEAEKQIAHAEEVARVLRRNVVQGQRVDVGDVKEEDGGLWRLRLHGEIERGDNETVKMAGSRT